jgi:two-component system chemotaxis response regulator CheB
MGGSTMSGDVAVPSVLIVDDRPANLLALESILEPLRVHTVRAASGEEALKQLLKHEPDVVTLDLEMPVMDGFAFLRWVMHNKPTSIIVVSSRASDRSVFKALELGALDFIAKPGGRVSPRLEEIERDLVAKVAVRLQTTAAALAEIDVLAALAELARSRNYVRPNVVAQPVLEIEAGRDPVLDITEPEETVVPK